jgi:phage gp29-like protein
MAPELTQLAKPPAGEIVTDKVLESLMYGSSLAMAQGFGGTSNPTTIFDAMMRDTQFAFNYYRELEEKDEDAGGALEELKLAIISRDATVTPADDSTLAIEVSEFIQQQLSKIKNFDQALWALLDAPGHGVAIAETIFDVSMGQVSALEIKDRPQELFTFNPMSMTQNGPLRYLPNGTYDQSGGTVVPETKFLVFSYLPRAGNRRGSPLLRKIFWLSWFKRQSLRFWLRYGEKGPGTAAVKYPQGATDPEKAQALAAAEAIVSKIAVAIPENFSMVEELLTAARSQNPAVYEKLLTQMADRITRRIAGQTLTSHGSDQGAGTQALGTVHEETKYQKTCAIAKGLQCVINDQLVKPLVLWNFGPNAPAPKWTINLENEEDLAQRVKVDQALQQMGAEIPKSYALKTYGIPELKGDDVALSPRSTPAVGTPGLDPAQPDPVEYSEEAKARAKINESDIQQLFVQLKKEAQGVYIDRIVELAKGAGLEVTQ